MTMQTIPSKAVQDKAARLLEDRHRWTYVRNQKTGVAFVAVPSSCCDPRCPQANETHEHIRQVRPDGRGCSCKAGQQWNPPMCSHRLAVIGANHQDALASWIADAAEPANDGPLVCRQAHCDGVQEVDSSFCWRHAPVCAFG